jgi:hypothetical protein
MSWWMATTATTALFGNDADNTLQGGGGDDSLDGGNGSDSYRVSGTKSKNFAGFDSYNDTGVAGTDRIVAIGTNVDIGLRNFSAGSGIEQIDASGVTGTVRLLGDWSADTIDLRGITVLGKVIVDGASGDDRLIGSTANDDLRGGSNNDLLMGGAGQDSPGRRQGQRPASRHPRGSQAVGSSTWVVPETTGSRWRYNDGSAPWTSAADHSAARTRSIDIITADWHARCPRLLGHRCWTSKWAKTASTSASCATQATTGHGPGRPAHQRRRRQHPDRIRGRCSCCMDGGSGRRADHPGRRDRRRAPTAFSFGAPSLAWGMAFTGHGFRLSVKAPIVFISCRDPLVLACRTLFLPKGF